MIDKIKFGTDGWRAIIAKEFTDPRVKIVVLDENQGVAEARNTGLKLASGRYVAFCDADDYWYAEKLSVQIELLNQFNVFVCHSNCHLVNVSGEIIGMRKYPMFVTYKMMKSLKNFTRKNMKLFIFIYKIGRMKIG